MRTNSDSETEMPTLVDAEIRERVDKKTGGILLEVRCPGCGHKFANATENGLEMKCPDCSVFVRVDVRVYKLRLYERLLSANQQILLAIQAT